MSSATAPSLPSSSRIGDVLVIVGVVLGIAFIGLMVQINTHMVEALSPRHTMSLMLLDLALILLVMTYSVSRRARMLWARARSGLIGTRLQSRIIMMFCVIAIIPTITVSLFSAYFFNYGIKTWFDGRVSHALEDSIVVATAYLDEHKGAIRGDALSMAPGIASNLSLLSSNAQLFRDILNDQIETHDLSEAIIFDGHNVLARTSLSFSLMFERLPEEVLRRADEGKVVVFGENQDKIQAVLKMSNAPRLYMMVSRVVDASVLQHMESARRSVAQYEELQNDISVLQRQFFMIFILVALLVLLASVWAGMKLSTRLIDPLLGLMAATERVRAGDYSIKVPEGRADDEIANLGRTFNRMTGQLEAQRRDLMEANRLGDERRRFAEAVLSGVSAGIIAVDAKAEITLNNRTALELLGVPTDQSIVTKNITELLPEVTPILAQAQVRPDRIASADIVMASGAERVTLHVQVVAERFKQTIEGFIVTFDDITELVAAQRSAAWADVARRVAHEIKNPLTPITLSAERLRKKFGPEISSDRESYERYLDTIVRHSKDIGRMVEEFVSYARVPTAKFAEENLNNIVRKSVFSERTVHPEINYQLVLPEVPVMVNCDEAQIGQILTNLLKNAAESLEQTPAPRTIVLTIEQASEAVTLTVCDNGAGFPTELLERLTDPYVTTRAKGTGLGLSIVKQTMEEHGGSITLANVPEGGAEVTLRFPRATQ
jgi:two-component system nitrogen regulation sensor histidine kinase NtrY